MAELTGRERAGPDTIGKDEYVKPPYRALRLNELLGIAGATVKPHR